MHFPNPVNYVHTLAFVFSRADGVVTHKNGTTMQCCSGFCIDLLERFSEELGFTYELVRVEDGKWGVLQVRKENHLPRTEANCIFFSILLIKKVLKLM